MTDTEALLAAALLEATPPNKHGQLCPVWTQRNFRKQDSCDCWASDPSRAARVLATPSGSRLLAPTERERELEAALEMVLAEEYCPPTSGGTEGKWCLNHDRPMTSATECFLVSHARAALAQPAPEEAP